MHELGACAGSLQDWKARRKAQGAPRPMGLGTDALVRGHYVIHGLPNSLFSPLLAVDTWRQLFELAGEVTECVHLVGRNGSAGAVAEARRAKGQLSARVVRASLTDITQPRALLLDRECAKAGATAPGTLAAGAVTVSRPVGLEGRHRYFL